MVVNQTQLQQCLVLNAQVHSNTQIVPEMKLRFGLTDFK